MSDSGWVILRAILMAGGGFFAGKGYVSMQEVLSFVDSLQTVIPSLIATGGALWAVWVRWNTRAVPMKTAARADVPTVSAVTGMVEPGSKNTGL